MNRHLLPVLTLALLAVAAGARAQESAGDADRLRIDEPANVEAHLQATYIWQRKPAFGAAYSGANSLRPEREKSYSFSGTAFLGVRAAPGLEFYLNPEVIQGVPLSHLTGLGSPTNGEMQKVAGANPKGYLPRAFVRKTWNLAGEQEAVESAPNQMAGTRSKRRVVLSAGKMSVVDVFDANPYSHDARSQFMTWSSLAQGAYDYVADAQGYTWGAALEYFHDDWELRAGRFVGPRESNGQKLNYRVFRFYGDQVEAVHHHDWDGRPGAVRVLLWRNHEEMGSFQDALDFARANGGTPALANVRKPQSKWGYGLHLDQALAESIGAFVRYSWGDGRTETYSFEEVDRSTQLGVVLKGAAWGREGDTLGLLAVRNQLSASHRGYLAQGGLGGFIGDGRLNYRPEQVTEIYYNLLLAKGLWLGLDVQQVRNPAYNADRGPVRAYALRLHAEY
ncbi:MAG: carbohydrate porin [Comamonas sp.]